MSIFKKIFSGTAEPRVSPGTTFLSMHCIVSNLFERELALLVALLGTTSWKGWGWDSHSVGISLSSLHID